MDRTTTSLASGDSKSQTIRVGGRRLKLTNLDKILYPATGTTKREVVTYYLQVAPHLITHAHDRPVTRKRWVDGVDEDAFFQKNLDSSTPDWVPRVEITYQEKTNEQPLANAPEVLAWLAQTATLELHTPQWRVDDDAQPEHPDRLVFDLDPGTDTTLRDCAGVARWVRDKLAEQDLDSVPATSGSKGIHVYALLDGARSSDEASDTAERIAHELADEHPDECTASMRKADRDGKVFIDWSQNNRNKTTVAPYSLRGRSHPTVAAPRTWRELASPHLKQLEFKDVLDRLEKRGDPLVG